MTIIFNIIIIIIIVLVTIGSIASWVNTKIILEELATIKKELGIKEEKKNTFLDDAKDEG